MNDGWTGGPKQLFILISDSVEVLGNMGRSVSLPCNPTSSPTKTVSLVMWFKGDTEDPIYSLDLRNVEVGGLCQDCYHH